MSEVNIRGVTVKFPFKPYKIQQDYMEKVIECLQEKQHGILESPTGTGKTCSLLCSSLAWLKLEKEKLANSNELSNKMFNFDESSECLNNSFEDRIEIQSAPKIIYASRTHSQLLQAMQEMKRTAYNDMRACILASRDQLCINTEVMNEKGLGAKVRLCNAKLKKKECHYSQTVQKFVSNTIWSEKTIVDIEDLVDLGQGYCFCPYFMSRELSNSQDVTFMPYNYLLDPRIRETLGTQFKNSVIILDEAHNVENVCEDCASFELKTTDIITCIDELNALIELMKSPPHPRFDPKCLNLNILDLHRLKEIFEKLDQVLWNMKIFGTSNTGETFDGDYIFKILESAGITCANAGGILELMRNIADEAVLIPEHVSLPTGKNCAGLHFLEDCLRLVFLNVSPEFRQIINESYKVHIAEKWIEIKKPSNRLHHNNSRTTTKQRVRFLNYWCFNPGIGMNMLLNTGCRCVILTSGTLAPLGPLISELGVDFQVRLVNPHIISREQVCVRVLNEGPDGEILNCSYQNRDNEKYINSLGRTISNLFRIIPNGILVFFPSYTILKKFTELWEESGVYDQIYQQKEIFIEPREKQEFQTAMSDYYSKINDPNLKGAAFFGVCRGKVSEGVDFADINGRAVVIIGLPYPPYKDPKIVLKQKYLDKRNYQFFKGRDWYTLEATRAVNQAMGRVIRHRFDYGAILLLDCRFGDVLLQKKLSMWIRNYIKRSKNFGEIIGDLRKFYINAKEKWPVNKDKHEESISSKDEKSSTSLEDGSVDQTDISKILNLSPPEVNKPENNISPGQCKIDTGSNSSSNIAENLFAEEITINHNGVVNIHTSPSKRRRYSLS